ncbi:MAG: desulfoferrodoxin FeS4 iron-binding domain-containing protein [Dehalococcoidales bacterium]|nr:desulfoferrodoxin FeS4 iron-binding domain-containing protein [Dehalococcoidales bacterium]
MAVEKVGENYKCNICGNQVIVTKAGGGVLVCCGEDMLRIDEHYQSKIALPENMPDSGV